MDMSYGEVKLGTNLVMLDRAQMEIWKKYIVLYVGIAVFFRPDNPILSRLP
jgi:hypothetical protein